MTKRILSIVVFSFFLSAIVFPPGVGEAASLSLLAPSVVLLDGQSQRVVFSRSPNSKRAPASTTKILTAMVVLDHLDLSQVVQVSSAVEGIQPSKIQLHGGEQFYVRDLMKALLINSANDAALALAIAAAGSQTKFSLWMNQKAHDLGAANSRFVHPAGLPASGQYSTAYDLAKIMMAASRYPYIIQTLKRKEVAIQSLGGRRIFLRNHNKMLWRTQAVIGKTGWTRNAKHCFAGSVPSQGGVIYVGIMGDGKRSYLWSDLYRIAAFARGKVLPPVLKKERSGSFLLDRQKVKKIQAALKSAGFFKGNPTGFYGKRTKNAVRQFQLAHQLPVTGMVGAKTWKKLKTYFR